MFGRAIHSLSKIGEELYIEPLENGVSKSSNSKVYGLDDIYIVIKYWIPFKKDLQAEFYHAVVFCCISRYWTGAKRRRHVVG